MPNTPAAKKSLRQDAKRNARNRSQRTALRNVIKKCRAAAAGDDSAVTESAFRLAVKKLDQAAAKNLIHNNKAARTKSRLSKLCKSEAAPATSETAPAASDD